MKDKSFIVFWKDILNRELLRLKNERMKGCRGKMGEEKVMIKNPVRGISSHHYHVIQDEIQKKTFFLL